MDFGKHLAMFSTFTAMVVMVCVGVMSMAVAGASTPYEKQARINAAARELVLAKEDVIAANGNIQFHDDMATHYTLQARKASAWDDTARAALKAAGHEVQRGAANLDRWYRVANRSYREAQLDDALAAGFE